MAALPWSRQVGPSGNEGAVAGFVGASLERYRRPGTYSWPPHSTRRHGPGLAADIATGTNS